MDSVFDAHWKEEVEDNVNGYSSLAEEVADILLDKEIEKGEIVKCLTNLKKTRLVVVMEYWVNCLNMVHREW